MNQPPFIPGWLDDAKLSPAEFRVLSHLFRRADNDTGIAWPSYATMTKTCGMGKTSIRRAIQSLQERKLIVMDGKPFGGSCRYRILPAIVPSEGQLEASNSSESGTIEAAPIVPSQDCNSSESGTPIVPPEGQEGSPKKVLQRRFSKKGESVKIDFPPELSSDRFADAWRQWEQHRREKKQKLTPTSSALQIKKLASIGEERAVGAILHSIEKGYTGIFEGPAQTNGRVPATTTPGGTPAPVQKFKFRKA